jgi:hypothetical protein
LFELFQLSPGCAGANVGIVISTTGAVVTSGLDGFGDTLFGLVLDWAETLGTV